MTQPRWQDDLGTAANFAVGSGVQLADPINASIDAARDALLEQQNADGSWCGELEGDSILESEYVLLLVFLGREQSDQAKRAAHVLAAQQTDDGHWGQYPGAPIDVSASVKAYFALKLTGTDPETPAMRQAIEAIHAAGGAEQVNSFTRFYLALLGVLRYDQCPAVPPELMLLPKWCPFNILEMSAWSRTIVVPLSIMWATRPKRNVANDLGDAGKIDELFLRPPGELSASMALRGRRRRERIVQQTFLTIDRIWKCIESTRLLPFRRLSLRLADRWMRRRFEDSDGVGAIFPPIVWSIIALKGLGESDDHPDVLHALHELERLAKSRDDNNGNDNGDKIQPCHSPVWDTALATIALADAGLTGNNPAIAQARRYLLSKQTSKPGDWAERMPGLEAGGWFFEHANEFYPDIDDTAMVLMALTRALPSGSQLAASLEPTAGKNATYAAVVAGRAASATTALQDVLETAPALEAMSRGLRWLVAMRSSNAGWAAFDRDNTRELFCHVPFADHNAMIDPPTADITARVLEAFGRMGIDSDHSLVREGTQFILNQQEYDGAWEGRWGVNYLYGTWQAVEGLVATGMSQTATRIRHAIQWVESVQQPCGGWGETPATYDDPTLRGQGTPTPSQTAWAVLTLIAAGRTETDSCRRGIDWLIERQRNDGNWDEPEFTGTGFPKVFYLRYHLYRLYFPLMALARFQRATNT